MSTSGCSPQMQKYFDSLANEAENCYRIAAAARRKGLDPETSVELPRADDLAATVEKLLGYDGIADTIRALSKKYNREEVAVQIGREIAKDKSKPREQAITEAVRAGLAVLTEGRCCAPLEGVTDVKINRNPDGSEYVTLFYAGPIRSAGGTAQAMSVLIADVARRDLGMDRYKPTKAEIERFKEEIPLYKQCQHLQYTPSAAEIETIVEGCPVCIDGEGTEDVEISGYRDLPRIETNRVRGGACLIVAEGLSLKAPKVQKHVKKLGIDGWDFLDKYLKMKSTVKGDGDKGARIKPNYKYMAGALAGRPVLSHPMRVGGFRLRYGRTRTTGLAGVAVHPAAMYILEDFISIGTQIKIERPGKAGAVVSCTDIEPPVVLLESGDLIEIDSIALAVQVKPQIRQIIDLGEILIPFGEFVENNHTLVPGAYSREWWMLELRKEAGAVAQEYQFPDAQTALELSDKYRVPLHPDYNLFWHDLGIADIAKLSEFVLQKGAFDGRRLLLSAEPEMKALLVGLGALHAERDGKMIFTKYSLPLIRCLGLSADEGTGAISRMREVDPSQLSADLGPLDFVTEISGLHLRERGPTRIGTKMGRPEKAGPREMTPPPHVLFPLGDAGGNKRLVSAAVAQRTVYADLGKRECQKCRNKTYKVMCDCGGHTVPSGRVAETQVSIADDYNAAMARLGETHVIPTIKAVQGLISKHKTPEPLEKGILRAKHGIYVFKDGTCRFDMTNITMTHFKPAEIGITAAKARELGYETDYLGKPLVSDEQVCELRCQDLVVSRSCGEYLVKVSKFIDELLAKHYKMKPHYNAENPEDILGQMTVGLSPHTSGGVLCRIIGYTSAQGEYAHPYFHAAKRRNADGDEDCVMLLLDALLNFSRSFLPEKRGGLMDAPLVLTTRINPAEIDKEAHNVDTGASYPIELYEAAARYAEPKEVEPLIDNVAKRIGTPAQYEGFCFTHGTDNISLGPALSLYKKLNDMTDKLDAQLKLNCKIRAVDVNDATSRLIDNHFLPDMIGNLRKFSTQQVRCTKCNKKYRRVPLAGVCTNPTGSNGGAFGGGGNGICGNHLTLTVHEGSVKKYLEKTKEICEAYKVGPYVKQQISVVEYAINSTFQNDKIKKCRIDDFM